jgi:hypothetical protein
LTSEEIGILQRCPDLFENIDEVLQRKQCDGSLARFKGTDVRAVVLGREGHTIVLQVVVGAQLFDLPPGGTVRIKRNRRGKIVSITTDASTAFDPLGEPLE